MNGTLPWCDLRSGHRGVVDAQLDDALPDADLDGALEGEPPQPALARGEAPLPGVQCRQINCKRFEKYHFSGSTCMLGTEWTICSYTRIMTSMGQTPRDDIKIPGPQWDT